MTDSETNRKKQLTPRDVVKEKPIEGTPWVYPVLDFSMFPKPEIVRDLYDTFLASRSAGEMFSQERALREFTKKTGLDPLAIHAEVEQRKAAGLQKSIGK